MCLWKRWETKTNTENVVNESSFSRSVYYVCYAKAKNFWRFFESKSEVSEKLNKKNLNSNPNIFANSKFWTRLLNIFTIHVTQHTYNMNFSFCHTFIYIFYQQKTYQTGKRWIYVQRLTYVHSQRHFEYDVK